jgi:aminopeptidase-like protein
MIELELDRGSAMHELMAELYPFNRSLTGEGTRQTLRRLQKDVPELEIKEVPSGTEVFDWVVPPEWTCLEAYIITPEGEKICDFRKNNLHVVGYSGAVRETLSLEQLKEHLHTLPDLPDAIPYVTSYYQRRWGFCMSHKEFESLVEGEYQVVISSSHDEGGSMTYAEVLLPSTEDSDEEIFLSTYVCHPSMANNELSGPVVTLELLKWLKSLSRRRYGYRVVFIPETIGSLTYMSLNLKVLKERVKAGYVITCVGDERMASFMPSRREDAPSDLIGRYVLDELEPAYQSYTYLERGSDERQYCSPGANLPMTTVIRSKYGDYPEYHTSLDNLEFVTSKGLAKGFRALKGCLMCHEANVRYRAKFIGEPNLGKRGLYPTTSTKKGAPSSRLYTNILSYCDGHHDLLDLAQKLKVSFFEVQEAVALLESHDLLIKMG